MRTTLAGLAAVMLVVSPGIEAFAPPSSSSLQQQRALRSSSSSSPAQSLRQPKALTRTLVLLHESDPATITDQQESSSTVSAAAPLSEEPNQQPQATTNGEAAASTATNGEASADTLQQQQQQRRILGSQELLMLPRQWGPGDDVFPSMNHVSVTRLSATPSTAVLQQAIDHVLQMHPLLHSNVQGDGEPAKRIDLFQMVREGDPNPMTFVSQPGQFSAQDVLKVVHVDNDNDEGALDASWQSVFGRDLDDGSWCDVHQGPLWKVELHRTGQASDSAATDSPSALILSFNHAISDQSSANRLTDQILKRVAELEDNNKATTSENVVTPKPMPVTLEDSVLGEHQRWNDVQTKGLSVGTLKYVVGKAAEGFRSPVILPDAKEQDKSSSSNPLGALTIISGKTAGGQDEGSDQRQSLLEFRTLSAETTAALVSRCREQGVSVSNALTAAMTLTLTDFVGKSGKKRNFKILQSLDMRRFGAQLDAGDTVACMASSHDLMHGPLKDGSGAALRRNPDASHKQVFWNLAREGKQQTADFIAADGPQQAVRVFDFAMSISDLNNLVYLTAQSNDTKGRAYSAGVTNVGVYERQTAFTDSSSADGDDLVQIQHGRYQVQDVFFATPHKQSGCLYPVSCMTVNGRLQFTFTPVSPMVSEETNDRFANAMMELLEIMAGTKESSTLETADSDEEEKKGLGLPDNILTLTAAAVGLAAVLSHAGDWAAFMESVQQMKNNVDDPADFWAALNFWIFFAVGHPILQPILALSDVLHGSPGPQVGGLVPATFLAGNALVIGAFVKSKDFRNAVNIAAVSAFFAYVGAGLGGTAGLGDFNLALDDSYKGQVVKGCPAYDQVRQDSMDGFDINKYQGLWYEQKFHDWTQFKEVYDTTLGIKLTADGKGWVDDFAVKGPAPDAAPLSWDKSPVGNGAHYFLFGRIDEKDPPGILREKGFGVEFPNYIVDVQKDPTTGEYTEAIQFQCLERGGVRVFEGINFMSRKDTMTDAEMAAMHARAEKAGMFPYGASPEQMHTVARRPADAPELDNNWQTMWRAIGLDKLLELLTEAIEDGGRAS